MNPEAINRLKQLPEFLEFVSYLAERVASLNTLDGLNLIPHEDITVETIARLRAMEKLSDIITLVTTTPPKPEPSNSGKDYQM